MGVFFPNKRHAEGFFKERKHLAGAAKNGLRVRGVLGFDVVFEREAASGGVAQERKIAHGNHREVGRVWEPLPPVVSSGGVGVGFRVNEQAVGECSVLIINGQENLLRHFFIGRIHRRKPAGVVFGLALRPDLARFVGFQAVGIDKIKTFSVVAAQVFGQFVGFGHVVNLYVEGVEARVGAAEF